MAGVCLKSWDSKWAGALGAVLCFGPGAAAAFDQAPSLDQLSQLSIEQLEDLQVTSVSKHAQPVSAAAAAIYVITADDIRRSGAVTLPEVLRLAPNLEVIQVNASRYIITARGLSGNLTDQNFSNKLLVLIDGRTVYSPMFSGVYWDMQDVVLADIERIEVVSGPGATLWGANAVNGVINIITRTSAQTQGALVDASAGNLEQSATLRYGGKLNDDLTYRLYVKDYFGSDTETRSGMAAGDHWSKPQGGFRFDWAASTSDAVTFQGDSFAGNEANDGLPHENISGTNVLGHWTHTWDDGSSLQIQSYFDHAERSTEQNNGMFWVDTYDVDVLHNFNLNDWNEIAWGGGTRTSRYKIVGTSNLFFIPASGALNLGNAFAQDTMSITHSLTAVLGFKLEDDPYSGLAFLPNARLAWQYTRDTLFWAAVSRAIRSPTPFDRDVVEKFDSQVFLTGGENFQPETLTAYELGTRLQPTPKSSLSVSAFYNVYDALRSFETTPVTFLPIHWGNGLRGDTYGFEAWGNYQLESWWRLSASWSELAEDFSFKSWSSGLLGVAQLGDDPKHRATLRSAINLGSDVTFDTDLRYVSTLPNPHVASFVEIDASVGWQFLPNLRLSLAGFNLLHSRHLEFPTPTANAVPRSFSARLQWTL